MDYIKLLASKSSIIQIKYKNKILGEILRLNLPESIFNEILKKFNVEDYYRQKYEDIKSSSLNNTDKAFLNKFIQFNKEFSDSNKLFLPSLNDYDEINKNLVEYKSYIYNILVTNFKLENIDNITNKIQSLISLQKKIREELTLFARKNYPIKNGIIIPSTLQKNFNIVFSIEKNLNPRYIIQKDNFLNPFIFETLQEYSNRNKNIKEDQIIEKYNSAQFSFLSSKDNLNLIASKTIENMGNIFLDLSNLLTEDSFNDIFKNSSSQFLSANIFDLNKLKKFFVDKKIIKENTKFVYFLKKNKIENNFLLFSILDFIIDYINQNGFLLAKIFLKFKKERVNSGFFWYTVVSTIYFDLKDLVDPRGWFLLSKKIYESFKKTIIEDNDKYEGDENLYDFVFENNECILFKIELEIWRKNNLQFFVRGKESYKKQEYGCLLYAVYKIFIAENLISSSLKVFDFLSTLPENLQFFLLTGSLIQALDEIVKIYNLAIFYYKDNLLYKQENLNAQTSISKYFLLIKNCHVSILKNKPHLKKFELKTIKKPEAKDSLIIAWDIETFTENEKYIFGNQTPYCVCTFSLDEEFTKCFWGLDCIRQFISFVEMCPKNTMFWSFNGSRFDHQFILEELLNIYGTKVQIIGSILFSKQIVFDDKHFSDFNLFFSGSLNSVCKNFGVEGKENFDIGVITKDNYISNKNNIIKYCFQDCRCLFLCISKFLSVLTKIDIYSSIDFSFTKIPTASSLTLLLVKGFLENEKIQIFGENRPDILKIEKEAYHGGVCLTFKKYISKGFCYDINSSYPFSMTQNLPFEFEKEIKPCLNCEILEHDLICFDYEIDNDIFSPFPEKCENGSLIYVKKHQNSWHWGIEFLFCQKNIGFKNYQIKRILRYKSSNFLKKFIDYFYQKRVEEKSKGKDGNQSLQEIYKLILNSVYGKFGQKFFNKQLLINKYELSRFENDNDIKEVEYINEKYSRVFFKDDEDFFNQVGSLVRLASFITAFSRTNLFTAIKSIGFENIAYCDTDSIFTLVKLPDSFINNTILGKFKLEYEFTDFYSVCPKVYACKIGNKEKIKIKSVKVFEKEKQIVKFNDIVNLATKDDFEFSVSCLQFTRTRDLNIKISSLIKTISSRWFKRKFIDINLSKIYYDINEYYTILESLKTAKIEKKEVDKIQQNMRKIIKEDNLFISNILSFTNEELALHYFKTKEEIKYISSFNKLFYKNELFKKYKDKLIDKDFFFYHFLICHEWSKNILVDENVLEENEIFWFQEIS